MIKSLFEDDENGDTNIEPKTEPLEKTEMSMSESEESAPGEDDLAKVVPFEVTEPIGKPPVEEPEVPEDSEDILEQSISEIEAELLTEEFVAAESLPSEPENDTETKTVNVVTAKPPVIGYDDVDKDKLYTMPEDSFGSAKESPSSMAETMRKSGLAYSAAIALFGSVVFMLIMGWFADLILGIAPWGTVVGIVIGAAIGFLQLFRITSKIIEPKPNDFDRVSFKSNEVETATVEAEAPANVETIDSKAVEVPVEVKVVQESAEFDSK